MKKILMLIVTLLFTNLVMAQNDLQKQTPRPSRGGAIVYEDSKNSVEFRLVEEPPEAVGPTYNVKGTREAVALQATPILTAHDFASATIIETKGKKSLINLNLRSTSAEKMQTATKENIGKRLAFVVNGQVLYASWIRDSVGTMPLGAQVDTEDAKKVEKIISENTLRAIRQTVNENMTAVHECQDEYYKTNKTYKGKVTIAWQYDDVGKVTFADLVPAKSDKKTRILGRCIAEKIKDWKFVAASKGKTEKATYPFVFTDRR